MACTPLLTVELFYSRNRNKWSSLMHLKVEHRVFLLRKFRLHEVSTSGFLGSPRNTKLEIHRFGTYSEFIWRELLCGQKEWRETLRPLVSQIAVCRDYWWIDVLRLILYLIIKKNLLFGSNKKMAWPVLYGNIHLTSCFLQQHCLIWSHGIL